MIRDTFARVRSRLSIGLRPRIYNDKRILEGAELKSLPSRCPGQPDKPALGTAARLPRPRAAIASRISSGTFGRVFQALSVDTAVLIGLSMRRDYRSGVRNRVPASGQGTGPRRYNRARDWRRRNCGRFPRRCQQSERPRKRSRTYRTLRSVTSAGPPTGRMGTRQQVIQTPEFVARAAIRSMSRFLIPAILFLRSRPKPALVIAGSEDLHHPTGKSEILRQGDRRQHPIHHSEGWSFFDA